MLLAALHEDVPVKPDLETLLAGLTEAQLRRILRGLAEGDPALIAAIEQEVAWLTTAPVAPTQAPVAHGIAVDLAAVRREIRKDLRNAGAVGGGRGYGDRYWDYDEEGLISTEEILGPHRNLAERLLEAGDAAAATEVIAAMIEEWRAGIADLEEWVIDNNQDVLSEAASDLGVLLAEALSVHPGEILSEDFMKPLGISQYRLAKAMNVYPRKINEIVQGKRAITADTALRLARFFGTSPEVWLNLQAHYDLELARDALEEAVTREVTPFQALRQTGLFPQGV